MPQKRARPGSSVEGIDGREDAPREEEQVLLAEDDAERTLSDLHVPMEVEVVVAESSARRMPRIPQGVDFERAGLQLRAIRLLQDDASRRAALPPTEALEDPTAWPVKRLRSLAFHCKLKPAKGLMRSALVGLLGDFREGPCELDLNEAPPPQSVDLDALQDELPGDGREEVARLRALEMNELLATVEEEEREAEDADAQAEKDRVEEEEALAAVHASQMQDLQERLSATRRAKAQRRPLLPPACPRSASPPRCPVSPADGVSRGADGQAPSPPGYEAGRPSARGSLARCRATCAGGCWERPRGARFFLSLIVLFFLCLFCLLVNIGGACVE